jgi:predicted GNAT family acetyltransferase
MKEKIQISKHRVNKVLEDRGISKSELYKTLGITRQVFWDRCKYGWSLDDAVLLALELGVPTIKIVKTKTEDYLEKTKTDESKIQISKHRVNEVLERRGISKSRFRRMLNLTVQGIYYRYKHGWSEADALFLATALGVDLEKLRKV